MARKAMKPNKSIAKRFRVTKTGKLKRHHGFTSHLMSSRSGNRRRKLRKAAVLPESHARRLRKLIGQAGKGPGQLAAARARRAAAAKVAAAAATAAASKPAA